MIENDLSCPITFLLGKNGCGKSTLLRQIDQRLASNSNWFVRYITPERGGELKYNSGVDQNIRTATNWLENSRRKNRFEQFREQVFSELTDLERMVLREIQNDRRLRADHEYTFDRILEEVNALVPLVGIRANASSFELYRKSDGSAVGSDAISSGESEAIALGVETLVFSRKCQGRAERLLLLDEPDVHLHPDLQTTLLRFLERLAVDKNFKILIATHSTALVSAIQDPANCKIGLMPIGHGGEIQFSPLDDAVRTMVPVFGAHPLSNAFNDNPILLLEGDDDVRIWTQVIRSSQGQVHLYPCPAGSIDRLSEWENWLVRMLPALYDEARAYSLRDRDGVDEELDDRGPLVRMRLGCRAAENLLLADETIKLAGTTWADVVERFDTFREEHPTHPMSDAMRQFVESGYDRYGADIKQLRNVFLAIMGVSKPWEVLVGQSIWQLTLDAANRREHSLRRYLGEKVCEKLLAIE